MYMRLNWGFIVVTFSSFDKGDLKNIPANLQYNPLN